MGGKARPVVLSCMLRKATVAPVVEPSSSSRIRADDAREKDIRGKSGLGKEMNRTMCSQYDSMPFTAIVLGWGTYEAGRESPPWSERDIEAAIHYSGRNGPISPESS
jgi:hypothetical protein